MSFQVQTVETLSLKVFPEKRLGDAETPWTQGIIRRRDSAGGLHRLLFAPLTGTATAVTGRRGGVPRNVLSSLLNDGVCRSPDRPIGARSAYKTSSSGELRAAHIFLLL